jgi:hypothetical protein
MIIVAPLGELDLLAGQVFEAGGVAVLVDLAPIGQDLGVDAALENAAFALQRVARVAQILVREVGNAGRAHELEPEAATLL